MSTDTGKSSTESEVSGLDYEGTELKLGLPGGARSGGSEPERKRGFAETVDLNLGVELRARDIGDRSTDSSDGPVSVAGRPPAAKLVYNRLSYDKMTFLPCCKYLCFAFYRRRIRYFYPNLP